MTGRPAQLLKRAHSLIQAQLQAPAQIHPTPGWKIDAERWLAAYESWLRPEAGVPESRWRPIDSDGTVADEPAPEPPDDLDEGETGPPETQQ